MVCYFLSSWIFRKSLIPPKVSFLFHEATTVIEESSTSPAHSEPADVQETHLPTEHDSVIPRYRPKCDAILGSPLMASATQRMKYGGGYRLIFPGHSTLSRLFVALSITFDIALRKRQTQNHSRRLLAFRPPQSDTGTRTA